MAELVSGHVETNQNALAKRVSQIAGTDFRRQGNGHTRRGRSVHFAVVR